MDTPLHTPLMQWLGPFAEFAFMQYALAGLLALSLSAPPTTPCPPAYSTRSGAKRCPCTRAPVALASHGSKSSNRSENPWNIE